MYKHSLSKKIGWLISLIITGFIVPGYAEITLDGSLGTAGTLPGPDYMIGAELGSRAGNNLFHSFGEFNINTDDSATFTGPSHIENIIGRVTGGHYSFIDGALNSTIPSANLYLLNPNGVMMGPNAKLNIDGSFHLSSADYLRFTDGQRFEANTKVSPLLTVAPPGLFYHQDGSQYCPNVQNYSTVSNGEQPLQPKLNKFCLHLSAKACLRFCPLHRHLNVQL